MNHRFVKIEMELKAKGALPETLGEPIGDSPTAPITGAPPPAMLVHSMPGG